MVEATVEVLVAVLVEGSEEATVEVLVVVPVEVLVVV